jgi:hypothetical protein
VDIYGREGLAVELERVVIGSWTCRQRCLL